VTEHSRKVGGKELSDKSPLERAARFLAAQDWGKEIQRPTPEGAQGADRTHRSRYALEVSEYMDRHWRKYVGPAQLMIRTCFKRPSWEVLSRICDTTGLDPEIVITVLDAAVIHTAADETVSTSPSNSSSLAASRESSEEVAP
jgi:hypothetical protein